MVQVSRSQAGTILRTLDWRTRSTNEFTQSVKHFQQMYNLGPALSVDGEVGPATSAALLRSYAAHKAGKPDISPHFSISEFNCTCNGRYSACARVWTHRKLLVALEKYRDKIGHSIHIVSGCRCVGRNSEIPGSATRSQHMVGTAADIDHLVKASVIERWGCGFSGLGIRKSDGEVCHVDVRDGASSAHPDLWVYGQW